MQKTGEESPSPNIGRLASTRLTNGGGNVITNASAATFTTMDTGKFNSCYTTGLYLRALDNGNENQWYRDGLYGSQMVVKRGGGWEGEGGRGGGRGVACFPLNKHTNCYSKCAMCNMQTSARLLRDQLQWVIHVRITGRDCKIVTNTQCPV